jgi:hypothetical protein
VNLAVDLALIPRLGALGAAIGLAAAIVANNLVPLAQVAISLRLHPFGPGTGAAAGLSVVCFGLVPLALVGLFGAGPVTVAAGAVTGLAGCLAGAVPLRRALRLDAAAPNRNRAREQPRDRARDTTPGRVSNRAAATSPPPGDGRPGDTGWRPRAARFLSGPHRRR